MMDLIDREKLLEKLDSMAYTARPNSDVPRQVRRVVDEIREAPAVDAVPVVRCKDCDLWNKWDNNADFCCSCANFSKSEEAVCVVYTYPDDYCSKGARK